MENNIIKRFRDASLQCVPARSRLSGCSSVGGTRALGARGRRFETCHSDHVIYLLYRNGKYRQFVAYTSLKSSASKLELGCLKFAVVAQLGSATDL